MCLSSFFTLQTGKRGGDHFTKFYFPRDVWWKNIKFPSKSDPTRKKLIHYFFTGAKNISEAEEKEVDALLNSPSVQKEFCDYMIHSSTTVISAV